MTKITAELKKKLLDMVYVEQLPYEEIARLLGVHKNTIIYYADEKFRDATKARTKQYSREHQTLTPEQKERRRKYMKSYFARRYNAEPEFKAKHAEHMKRWAEKHRKRKGDVI